MTPHATAILSRPRGTEVMVCEPVPVRYSALMGREAANLMPGKRLVIISATHAGIVAQDCSGDFLTIDASLADHMEIVP